MKIYNGMELFVKPNNGKETKIKRYLTTAISTEGIEHWFRSMFNDFKYSKYDNVLKFDAGGKLETNLKQYLEIMKDFFNNITLKDNKYVLKINKLSGAASLSQYCGTNHRFNEGDVLTLKTPKFDYYGDLEKSLTAFEVGMFDAFWYFTNFTSELTSELSSEEEIFVYREIVKYLESQKHKFKFISNKKLMSEYYDKLEFTNITDEFIKESAKNPLHLGLIDYFETFSHFANSNYSFNREIHIGKLKAIYDLYLSKYTKEELKHFYGKKDFNSLLEVKANKRVWSKHKDEIINKFIELYLK